MGNILGIKSVFQPLRGILKRGIFLPILLIIVITVFSVVLVIFGQSFNPMKNFRTANAAESQFGDIYLPIAMNRFPTNTLYGIEITRYRMEDGLPKIAEPKPTWVRYNRLLWSTVEEVQGIRDWSVLAEMEQNVINASSEGLKVVMIVRSAPTWAQKIPGAYCGPIKPDKLAAFGDFMYEAVSRYSKPPYNIKYWEIWNEPDVLYTGANGTSVWGCWGDINDPYYGGGYYAEMLKHVYPKIKAADPSAQVLLGGLLLDCDPRPNSNWCEYWNHDEKPPKFLEGVLLNGGGSYFDGISFHGYDYFNNETYNLGEYYNANWGNSWNRTLWDGKPTDRVGPVTMYKAQYLMELLNKYKVYGKVLLNTESALICLSSSNCDTSNSSSYEQTKARYVTQAYASAVKVNLSANIWFSLFGWRDSGLINSDFSIRPAYTAYKVSRQILGRSDYIRNVNYHPNVYIYEFERNNIKIWVIWSLDGSPQIITLPSTPDEVKDFMGVVKAPSGTFTATIDPHYLIWYP